MRRCSGIWPPSKPRLNLNPDRDFAPLWPRPACTPLPDPWPRPTRFFGNFDRSDGFRLLRSISFFPAPVKGRPPCRLPVYRNALAAFLLADRHEVTDLVNHAARRRRVHQFDAAVDPAQPHALRRRRLRPVEADDALDERDLQLLRRVSLGSLLGHYTPTISASSLPRMRATKAGSLSPIRPLNVARTTLCGFAEPSDFVSTFWMPHDSTTARTAPPAMRPVPSGAGLSSTLPEPNLPTTWCGIVAPLLSGTR